MVLFIHGLAKVRDGLAKVRDELAKVSYVFP